MFKKLFSKNQPSEPVKDDAADPRRLAIAALLVEAARADEHYDDREKAIIDKSLAATFKLAADAATALRAEAELAQADALDIQRFTRIAKEMSAEEKIGFIEQLWEIILSDGERDPFEDTLVRRICGLIYVDDRDSGAARIRVAARLAGG